MSSNIEVEKTCQYCGSPFTARTLYTRYCSKLCNNRAYKQAARDKKLQDFHAANKSSQPTEPALQSHTKDFLTIKEVCVLLNTSMGTIHSWLRKGVLQSSRLGKKHYISKETIYSLLK